MDSPLTPPATSPLESSQTPANLATPELPKAPEKLLPAAHTNSVGAIVGIIIIIIVLIVGALYFWGAQLEKQEELKNAETGNASAEESAFSDFDTGLDGFEEISE